MNEMQIFENNEFGNIRTRYRNRSEPLIFLLAEQWLLN